VSSSWLSVTSNEDLMQGGGGLCWPGLQHRGMPGRI